MAVTEEQRRVAARFQPVADKEQSDRLAWLRTHRLPGERFDSALRRRAALEAPRRRARLVGIVAAVEAQCSRLALTRGRYDDGMHDDEWQDLNPHRAFRIRSVRPSDNAWGVVTGPAILVVDTATLESLFVPPIGWPVEPMDHDAWGRAVFATRDRFNAENAE